MSGIIFFLNEDIILNFDY